MAILTIGIGVAAHVVYEIKFPKNHGCRNRKQRSTCTLQRRPHKELFRQKASVQMRQYQRRKTMDASCPHKIVFCLFSVFFKLFGSLVFIRSISKVHSRLGNGVHSTPTTYQRYTSCWWTFFGCNLVSGIVWLDCYSQCVNMVSKVLDKKN